MLKFFCPRCGKIHEDARRPVSCVCGSPLKSSMDWTSFDIDSGAAGMLRYSRLLPPIDPSITMGEGWTPLIAGGSKNLHYKLEYIAPTGSFKDRGSVVVMSEAKSLGCDAVVLDSSGNAGASMAAYATRAGIKATVVVPEGTPAQKQKQIELYGATLVVADGGRSRAASIAMDMAKSAFYASHVWNPLFTEGTRTVAFEIWEQLGGKAPDVVIVPVGNGTMFLGVFNGFKELLQRVKIRRLPKIVAVQGENCAPLFSAWKESLSESEFRDSAAEEIAVSEPRVKIKRLPKRAADQGEEGAPLFETSRGSPSDSGCRASAAEGIAIGEPPRMKEMLDAVRISRGEVVAVSDRKILAEQKRLAVKEGLLVEPTAAAASAVERMLRDSGAITERDIVVVPLTGTGLKNPPKKSRA